jgi:uncharacterized coiled-coil protein SlyX
MTGWLSYVGPIVAGVGLLGAGLRWYVVDRRKSEVETKLAEDTMQSDIDLRDTGARDARLLYVQRQVDMERSFHTQQIADRDAEIARQRAELAHRDDIIANLLHEVDRLEMQLAQMSREMSEVRSQLNDLSTRTHRPPPKGPS